MPAPLPLDEPFRLEALRRLRVLDSQPEAAFDRINQLAATLYRAPMATVTLVDANRQWFKACIGLQDHETSRDIALCAFTILQHEPLVVYNALEDARFGDYPNVQGEPHIRFYLGAPLVTRDGYRVGTLCVIDTVPRIPGEVDTRPLIELAAVVAELLELRSLSSSLTAPQHADRSYSAIIADIHDVIFQSDAANRLTFVNPAWSALTGYDLNATLGRSLFEFMHVDDVEAARSCWQSLALHQKSFHAVRRFVDAEGGTLWFDVTARPDTSAGTFLGATGTLHDLTELKRAELQLSAEREHLQKTLDTAADAFVAMTSEGSITEWNQAAERLFGFQRAEVIGQEMAALLVPERFRSAHRAGMRRYRESGIAQVSGAPVELVALHASGAEIPVEITIWPMRTGDELTFQSFLKDISARKRLAESIEQAKRAAEEASRAKSAFVASISHEIRTPMNVVLGMAEVLADERLSAEQAKYIGTIRRAGADLLAIINSVLDLSKIESGQLLLECADFDLLEAVDHTIDLIRTRVSRGVAIRREIGPDVPKVVNGDRVRLQQVLMNLLGNAAKFTQAGSIVLRIQNSPEERYRLQCEVIDTGIGIPSDKLQTIFDDFAQVDASTTRKYGGTGLGLSIARRLVELMSGEISVTSVTGMGSTFRFSVQLGVPESNVLEAVVQPVSAEPGKHRLLIAEDNPDNRMLLDIYLAGSGHVLTYASDGAEAVDLWRSNEYDLVLMDMQMPVMDGLEAVKRIRAAEAESGLKRTPIVALTANALLSDAQSSADAGCDGHLTKPIAKKTLLEAIERYTQAAPCLRVVMPEGLEEICPMYLKKRRAEVPRLRALLNEGKLEELNAAAHDLKGTGSAYGFPEITAIAEQIRDAVATRDSQQLAAHLSSLGEYLASVELVPADAS